eukprot:1599665-Rhodomonas_salina.8
MRAAPMRCHACAMTGCDGGRPVLNTAAAWKRKDSSACGACDCVTVLIVLAGCTRGADKIMMQGGKHRAWTQNADTMHDARHKVGGAGVTHQLERDHGP